MNSVGQSGDKKSYRIILLLVVGLTAFSSAMKELNLLREFSRDTSEFVASLSKSMTPDRAPAPPRVVVPVEVPQVPVEVEVCERSKALESAEPVEQIEMGGSVARVQARNKDVGKTFVAERSVRREAQAVATLRTLRSADIDVMELRKQLRREADLKVTIMADRDGGFEFTVPSGSEFKVPKVKTQWHLIKPEERDMLKNLNRSLNVRSAG